MRLDGNQYRPSLRCSIGVVGRMHWIAGFVDEQV